MTAAEQQFRALPKERITFATDAGSVVVDAVVCRSKMVVESATGAILQVQSHDYIVRASDLIIASVVVTPLKGNTVSRVFAGLTYTYQLMIPTFDLHDHAGLFLRLHSKLISTTQ